MDIAIISSSEMDFESCGYMVGSPKSSHIYQACDIGIILVNSKDQRKNNYGFC